MLGEEIIEAEAGATPDTQVGREMVTVTTPENGKESWKDKHWEN